MKSRLQSSGEYYSRNEAKKELGLHDHVFDLALALGLIPDPEITKNTDSGTRRYWKRSVIEELKNTIPFSATADTLRNIATESPRDIIPSDLQAEVDLEDDFARKEGVKSAMETLNPRERVVIEMRFGMEDGVEHSLEEVGKKFNVTSERIRQIQTKAMRKLRHPFRKNQLKGQPLTTKKPPPIRIPIQGKPIPPPKEQPPEPQAPKSWEIWLAKEALKEIKNKECSTRPLPHPQIIQHPIRLMLVQGAPGEPDVYYCGRKVTVDKPVILVYDETIHDDDYWRIYSVTGEICEFRRVTTKKHKKHTF